MPAMKPSDIRNIVLLGHGGSGKTSLCESILFTQGVTTRLGSVSEGTSTLDFTELEKKREHSVDPAMGFVDVEGKTINFLDAPGYSGFIGGALPLLGGADAAVVVVGADAGIEVMTRRHVAAARAASIPIAFVINKIDAETAELAELTSILTETFGSAVKPMNLPTGGGTGVIDCFKNAAGESDFGDVAAIHEWLVESVIESDEGMMESYLGGEEICADTLGEAFATAMIEGTIIPVFYTNACESIGVAGLFSDIAAYFPKPGMVPGAPVMNGLGDDAEEIEIQADASKPFVGQAFKITSDPFVGKLAWIRVLQGTAANDTHYHLRDVKKTAKMGHLFKVLGSETHEVKKAVAGEIVALAKVEEISLGDVLHVEGTDMYRATPPTPTPMFSLAVTPKARGDETKISEALHRLIEEDPTFKASRDSQTHETVISGIGDLHLRMILKKMKTRFNLEVDTKSPKIPYRETIQAPAKGHHRHKKQSGGSGQFGEVYLRVEPLDRGWSKENKSRCQFESELFGESIPRQFLPAIEKGVRDVCVTGAIAGFPLQDVYVAVTDGKHHPVDSKEIAFRTAAKHAFIDAIRNAKPVLLEPVVHLEISVPASFMGDIASDLAGRRGRIQGQDMLPGNIAVVLAQAPLSEVMQYNSQLRSVTGGRGSYTMELSHYEPVPGNVQAQIIADYGKPTEE